MPQKLPNPPPWPVPRLPGRREQADVNPPTSGTRPPPPPPPPPKREGQPRVAADAPQAARR
jgi:hypothetical protein